MLLPCEIAVKTITPAIKAVMAKELVTHGLNQSQVAEVLGISQSAVSKYTRQVRGHVIEISEIEEMKPLMKKMVNILVSENQEWTEVLKLFCKICTVIREKGVMCQFCRNMDSRMDECRFCFNSDHV